MSEDTLNAAIAQSWADAGLSDSGDSRSDEVTSTDEVADDDAEPTSDTDVDPLDTVDSDTPAESDEADPAADDPAPDADSDAAADAAKAVADATTPAEKKDAEDDLALALGLGKPPDDPKKRAQWWKTRLPYSQVHKAVSAREKALKDAHEGVVKQHGEKITAYDERFKGVKTVEDIIINNPDQYTRTLAAMFPDTYGKMFAPIFSGTAKAVEPKVAADVAKPEPDVDLGDGTFTYSKQGLEKLQEYYQSQTAKALRAEFQPHIDAIKQQADAQKQARAAEDMRIRNQQTTDEAIAEAKTWEMAEENFDAILEESMKVDKRHSALTALSMAYNKVVFPKLKAEREQMRKDILAEQKKAAAKKTSVAISVGQTARTKETAAPVSVDAQIKAAMKRKGLTI